MKKFYSQWDINVSRDWTGTISQNIKQENNTGNITRLKDRRLPCFTLLLVIFFSAKVFSQNTPPDPGVGGTQAGFEVDASFRSGFIPGFWNSTNYTPPGLPTGDDWSQGPSGNAVLTQSGGVSVPGMTLDGRSLWQVDGNWGNKSPLPELMSFQGTSNKNGDAIGSGQSPYSIQSGGSGPQKNDITNTFLHTRIVNVGGVPHIWLFFAAETRSVNGNSYLDFEYNQAGVTTNATHLIGSGSVNGRTEDDFLLVVNYTGGGNRPVVGVRKWLASGTWSDELPVGALGAFVTTNTTNVTAVAPNKAFTGAGAYSNVTLALQLVEGGVDITALGLNLDICAPEATVTVKTRSSSSYTSELKDLDILNFPLTPAPAAPSLTIVNPNCEDSLGTITITSPANPTTGDPIFEYSNNGGAWQTSNVFTFEGGDGYSIRVRRITSPSCISTATVCPAVGPSTSSARRIMPINKAVFEEETSTGEFRQRRVSVYPNPFSVQSTFEFKADKSGQATLNIYDVNGKLVKEVFSSYLTEGETYQIKVDGSKLTEGVYFSRLMLGNEAVDSQRFVIRR